ncbi:MAG: protein kinase, partial [Polyangiales bacterium]
VLHEEMSANAIVVERFLAEGDVCRRLDHPGILRVYDVGHQNGVPYLVMELLNGRALIEYTQHQQKLPVNFAITVSAGVLTALEYAHSRGVIHRDLKPENVFLVPSPPSGYQTKLLDFGIAKSIDAAGGGRKRTATGVLLGTPGYMSPEQVKGAAQVDHRADLWAVGVMFYEMVTGSTAFPADGEDPANVWGLISAVLTKEPVPLSLYDRHLAPFDAFIARALSKKLEFRYANAREMADDLLRIGRGEQSAVAQQRPSNVPSSAQAWVSEQRSVPINSHGELSAIPSLVPPPAVGIMRTVPSGGGPQAPLANTRPSAAPIPIAQQAANPAMAATAYAPTSGPAQGHGAHGGEPYAPTAYAASSPASPLVAMPPASANRSIGATSPSGFAPPTPIGGAPSPMIPPNQAGSRTSDRPDSRERGSGTLTWVLVGVVLVVALVAAVYWAAH